MRPGVRRQGRAARRRRKADLGGLDMDREQFVRDEIRGGKVARRSEIWREDYGNSPANIYRRTRLGFVARHRCGGSICTTVVSSSGRRNEELCPSSHHIARTFSSSPSVCASTTGGPVSSFLPFTLSLPPGSPPCEIHTRKRNRLTTECLNDLSFILFNFKNDGQETDDQGKKV